MKVCEHTYSYRKLCPEKATDFDSLTFFLNREEKLLLRYAILQKRALSTFEYYSQYLQIKASDNEIDTDRFEYDEGIDIIGLQEALRKNKIKVSYKKVETILQNLKALGLLDIREVSKGKEKYFWIISQSTLSSSTGLGRTIRTQMARLHNRRHTNTTKRRGLK